MLPPAGFINVLVISIVSTWFAPHNSNLFASILAPRDFRVLFRAFWPALRARWLNADAAVGI